MKPLAIASVLAVAGATFTVATSVLTHDRARGAVSAVAVDRSPAAAMARAEAMVAENPNDANAHALIAISALGRAKETADSSWYVRAQDAAAAALAIDPNNVPALDATATLANARHRFRNAIPPATTSLRLAGDRFGPLEILTDAHLELGHYRVAFALADRRLQLRPDLASSSRASYVAELRGNRALATSLMRLAVDTARAGSSDRAWARTQLGLLEFGSGRLGAAEKQMRIALAEAPDDSTATAGLARVLAARGDLTAAATLYRRSLDEAPVAGVASELAQVELMRGHPAASRTALAHAHEIDRREEINGVRLDLDGAAVDADFRRPTAADVARARRGHRDRPGVIGDDALGWVLTRAGRCDEGLHYARRSLRLGTRDATMLFHAGMAARCAGHPSEARVRLRDALALNPAFSVRWSAVARRTLNELSSR